MSIIKKLLLWTMSYLLSLSTMGQKNCSYKIDTASILTNKNLDLFLRELQRDTFVVTNNKKDIPKSIRSQLNCLTSGFSIANPNEEYNATDIRFKGLPTRQLIFLAKSKDILVMCYQTGGVGVTRHLLLIKFDNKHIVDLWNGFFNETPKLIKDVVRYIKENRDKEWGLNTNMIYF